MRSRSSAGPTSTSHEIWRKALRWSNALAPVVFTLIAFEGRTQEVEPEPTQAPPPQGIAIGTVSTPETGITLKLMRRFQSYQEHPTHPDDHYDAHIHSPKSAHFSLDGKKVYVNSLENMKTLVFDSIAGKRSGVILHQFDETQRKLFFGFGKVFNYHFKNKVTQGQPNVFGGKPVESALTHRGRYLWVPYYRRSFDPLGQFPSAIAVIDTKKDEIVRVMPTGPIAKGVAASPDGRFLAVSHWGDNTLSVIRIRGSKPKSFSYFAHLIVDKQANLKKVGVNRDQDCGLCVRGVVFSKNGRYLFVARMGDGGVAVFEMPAKDYASKPRYLGTIFGFKPKPRDLALTRDGKWMYMSAHASGFVTRVAVQDVIKAARKAWKEKTQHLELNETELPRQELDVGLGARTIRLSPDEKTLYVAVNGTSSLLAVDTETFQVMARIPVDPYPVGLDVSPDGKQVWVTSQGRQGYGGNSISVYEVAHAPSGHH